jgi:DnaJ-class molecular chaperone
VVHIYTGVHHRYNRGKNISRKEDTIMGEAYPCPECDGHPEDTDDGDYCDECGGDGYVVLDED